ncbi:MAG: methyltransferase [Alphaproteobacteria bacterium]|nr:methyltransferase [Alphaproteobacteria bacterium]
MAADERYRIFVRGNTVIETPPHVPEIALHLAHAIVPLWHQTEEDLAAQGVPPPFWAFAWAGGQALARYVIDHPETVRGGFVLDVGAGSGLGAIAAAKAGARRVEAVDIDPFAIAAIGLNAQLNDVTVEAHDRSVIGIDEGWDTVLIGDLCYDRDLAPSVIGWARKLARRGARVLIGDPGRAYLPKSGLTALATYEVQTTRELEDQEIRRTRVFTLDEAAP